MRKESTHPALKGGMLALLAAALFGLSTPMVQSLGKGVGSFTTAALLYAGAAVVAWVVRQSAAKEAGIQRSDWPRLIPMAGAGAVIGPVALAWGLQHTSGSSASLMLTLEAVFTAVLAWRWYARPWIKGRASCSVVTRWRGGFGDGTRRFGTDSAFGLAGRDAGHGRMGRRQHALTWGCRP